MRPPQKIVRRDNRSIIKTEMIFAGGSTILQHINQNPLYKNEIGVLCAWFNLHREDKVQVEITKEAGGREGNAVISHVSSHPIRHSKLTK